jgi:hypothetical protein
LVDTGQITDGGVTFAKLAAAAIVTESEGISSNDNDTTIPTSAAVNDFVTSQGQGWQYEWHPYDMVTLGDGNDGVFYDSGVDGVVATPESPDFEDGYTYRVIGEGLGHNGGGGARTLRIAFYRDTDAAYSSTANIVTQTGNENQNFDVEIFSPRVAKTGGTADGYAWQTGISGLSPVNAMFGDATTQTVGKVQFSWSTNSYDAGTLKLLRKRVTF